jgi:hypothetical protein
MVQALLPQLVLFISALYDLVRYSLDPLRHYRRALYMVNLGHAACLMPSLLLQTPAR